MPNILNASNRAMNMCKAKRRKKNNKMKLRYGLNIEDQLVGFAGEGRVAGAVP